MFETIINFFKKIKKHETKENSKEQAKERLHLVLMQDRANVSADFLEMMKQEIIEVIKKYIEVEENAIDVRLTNEVKEDGTTGAPSLYANIPILNIRNEMKKDVMPQAKVENKGEEKKEENKEEDKKEEKEEKQEESQKEDIVENGEKEDKEPVSDSEDENNQEAEEDIENEQKNEEDEDKKEE